MNLSSNSNSVPLSEVCTLKGGSGFPVKFQGKTSGDLPFIKVSDMNSLGNEKFIINSQNWLDTSDIPVVKPKVIPANSTVFAKVGAALLLNRRRILSFETAIDNNMMAAIPNERIDHSYLFYFMQTVDMAKLVQEGALPSINQSQVGKIQVPLPSLEEQRRIASILSTWEKAINAYDRLIVLKEKQKRGLITELLSDPESDLVRLSDVAEIKMGSSPPSSSYNDKADGLPLLQGNADIDLRNRVSAPRRFTSQVTKDCVPGDILMSVRAPVGSISKSNHHACIGRGLCSIRAKEGCDHEFLYQIMLSLEPSWGSLSQGSTFTAVSGSDVKNLNVRIPSFDKQVNTSKVLTLWDKSIAGLITKRDLLKRQKQGLMQQLLA